MQTKGVDHGKLEDRYDIRKGIEFLNDNWRYMEKPLECSKRDSSSSSNEKSEPLGPARGISSLPPTTPHSRIIYMNRSQSTATTLHKNKSTRRLFLSLRLLIPNHILPIIEKLYKIRIKVQWFMKELKNQPPGSEFPVSINVRHTRAILIKRNEANIIYRHI